MNKKTNYTIFIVLGLITCIIPHKTYSMNKLTLAMQTERATANLVKYVWTTAISGEPASIDGIKNLLRQGADVNGIDRQRNQTVLTTATWHNSPPIVEFLLDSGATIDTNKIKPSRNPFHAAASRNDSTLTSLLLKPNYFRNKTFLLNECDKNKKTPLEVATNKYQHLTALMLIYSGAMTTPEAIKQLEQYLAELDRSPFKEDPKKAQEIRILLRIGTKTQ